MDLTQEQLKQKVEMCMRQLHHPSFAYIKKYLNDRLITDDLIKFFEIGYGTFFGKRWITLPIKSIDGKYLFIKLRRDPKDDDNKNKFMFYPVGSKGTVFGAEELLKSDTIAVCEGEMDRILLHSRGVSAITSTLGAASFKKEWIFAFKNCKTVYIIFDKDEAGDKGAKRLGELILEEHPNVRVFQCFLPDELGDHGDVTDFFLKTDGNIDKLLYERSSPIKPKVIEQKKARTYSGENLNGEITDEDIANAKATDCKNFVDIVKSNYDTDQAHCVFGGGDHDKGNPSMCCYKGDKGFYSYCCGKGGDAIDLVREIEDLSFVEAVLYILKK